MTHLTTKHLGTVLAAAAALGAIGAAPAPARAQQAAQRIDTTFAFEKNGWVDVTIISGTIVITGWTRPEARLTARAENGLVQPSISAGRIGLSVRPDFSSRTGRNRLGPVTVEISVPIGTRVMATAVSGDVRVRGTAAEVQANTTSGDIEVVDANDRVVIQNTSGDIRLEKIRGRTRVGITSGDIVLDDITGSLEINSVSSDMRIRHVDVTDLRIGTTSGDITYDGIVDPKGTYEITTHSGDVRFELPENAGAVLSLQTYSGDIGSSFPMTLMPGQDLRRSRGRRMEFTVGNGGARVAITTFSGDITIARGPARTPREE
ncbi:MAG: DUF4097 family beta strand repeat-containing protein [Gemmatimonadota bacterium]|nr:DUF4097 family beta strand repeat-containing protein [Gemmatimonadota bacterium]